VPDWRYLQARRSGSSLARMRKRSDAVNKHVGYDAMIFNPRRVRFDAHLALVLTALLLAIALPLHIIVMGTVIADTDPERFAQLHLQHGFWWRASLTFVYFPAAVTLHLFVQSASRRLRTLFVAGFCLFLLGNAIDLLFRSVQFLVAHGVWAPQLLDDAAAATGKDARAKILAFNEIAPAFGFSFSLLFAVGRMLMGCALVCEPDRIVQLAGVALVATGILNMVFALTSVLQLAALGAIASVYPWVWLLGLAAVGVAAARVRLRC